MRVRRLGRTSEIAEVVAREPRRQDHPNAGQPLQGLVVQLAGPARPSLIGGFTADVEVELSSKQRLHRDTETAIYRIVQEALSNVVKHAQAESVRLRVSELSDRIQVAVEDDGQGFVPNGSREGFGLTGMRERAVLAGGQLSVKSTDGGPTCVTAVLPLPR